MQSMKAPMSDNIRKISSDTQKSKILSGQILLARKLGANPIIKIGQKRFELVRIGSHSKG